jgi:hypothetical protein
MLSAGQAASEGPGCELSNRPEELWRLVASFMNTSKWVQASGACRAFYNLHPSHIYLRRKAEPAVGLVDQTPASGKVPSDCWGKKPCQKFSGAIVAATSLGNADLRCLRVLSIPWTLPRGWRQFEKQLVLHAKQVENPHSAFR